MSTNIKAEIRQFLEAQNREAHQEILEKLTSLCNRNVLDVDLDAYEKLFGIIRKPRAKEDPDKTLIKVNVSDRNTKCPCWIKIKRDIDVINFRSLMLSAFGFPPNLQVVLAKDDVLNDNQIIIQEATKIGDHFEISLFLKDSFLTDRKVGDFQSWNHVRKLVPDYEPEKGDEEEVDDLNVTQSSAASNPVEEGPIPIQTVEAPIDDGFGAFTNIEPVEAGGFWICPACTFENEAWRPGCEVCSADKPNT